MQRLLVASERESFAEGSITAVLVFSLLALMLLAAGTREIRLLTVLGDRVRSQRQVLDTLAAVEAQLPERLRLAHPDACIAQAALQLEIEAGEALVIVTCSGTVPAPLPASELPDTGARLFSCGFAAAPAIGASKTEAEHAPEIFALQRWLSRLPPRLLWLECE